MRNKDKEYNKSKDNESKDNNSKDKKGKGDIEKDMTQLVPILIVSILKNYSSKSNPITLENLIKELTLRVPITISVSTMQRKLDLLVKLGEGYEELKKEFPFYIDIYRNLGGRVCMVEKNLKGNTEKKGPKPRGYYFDPILSESDISYICAALESTHILTKEEKKYMILRERAAYGNWNKPRGTGRISKKELELPPRPNWSRSGTPDNKPSMLNNIQKVLSAIDNEHQIEIKYGKYVAEEKSRLKFQDRGKTYCLNPYFIVSQNGLYYLVVTYQGQTQLNHFRIDRIFDIVEKQDKRENMPEWLQDPEFWEGGEFKTETYVSKFPLMQYPEEIKIDKYTFLCKADALSVPLDHFGNNLYVEDSGDGEQVKLRVYADYENVKFFCVQQSRLVTPVSPKKLKEDVKKILTEAIDRIG